MKMMTIQLPDGSIWGVPVDLIARSRAAHYASEFDGDIERSLAEDTDAPDIKTSLIYAQSASCTCRTKTPEVKYHNNDCRYRVLVEALDHIESLEHQLAEAKKDAVNHDAALVAFTAYFVANYPGPNTIIHDPKWHAPRIFMAALQAMKEFKQ